MLPPLHMKDHNKRHTGLVTEPARWPNNPVLGALVKEMAAAMDRRKRRTPWLTDAVRAELLDRFASLLDEPASSDNPCFAHWVIEDGRYLSAEGSFTLFCSKYLQLSEEESQTFWAEISTPC